MYPNTHILDLLKETGKFECKLIETPIEANHKLGGALQSGLRCVSKIIEMIDLLVIGKTRYCLCRECSEPIYA